MTGFEKRKPKKDVGGLNEVYDVVEMHSRDRVAVVANVFSVEARDEEDALELASLMAAKVPPRELALACFVAWSFGEGLETQAHIIQAFPARDRHIRRHSWTREEIQASGLASRVQAEVERMKASKS